MIRVVLGEAAEPHPGPLQLALLGSGILVSGHASNLEELDRVLEGVQPDAVVLDPQMGAIGVLIAREKAPGSAVVVVWPTGVSAAIADEHVEPTRIVQDLGDAVRRAVARVPLPASSELAPVIDLSSLRAVGAEVPEPLVILETAPAAVTPIEEAPSRRRALPVLLAAASFVLVIVLAISFNHPPVRTGALPPPPTTNPPVNTGPGPGSGGGPPTNQTQPPTNPPSPIEEAALITKVVLTGGSTAGQGGGSTPPGGSNGGGGNNQPPGTQGGGGQSGPPFGLARHGPPKGVGKSVKHGYTGQHGQSGESHGKSGQSHGKSGQSHGKSGQSHGKSGQSHGHSGH